LPEIQESKKGLAYLAVLIVVVVLIMTLIYIFDVPPTGPEYKPLTVGSLDYRNNSTPQYGSITFQLNLARPAWALLNDTNVVIIDRMGNTTNGTINWTHILGNPFRITGGDRITIEIPNTDIRGYKIVISFEDYSGTIRGKVPETRLGGE
jgi:hypothetical protein